VLETVRFSGVFWKYLANWVVDPRFSGIAKTNLKIIKNIPYRLLTLFSQDVMI
jgi:hypothetical protein